MTALIVAIIAAIAAVASTVFAGISLRLFARQANSLSDQIQLQISQTEALAKQTELQAGQYEILASATELQFNLDVMIRLQDVLLEVADDEESYSEVWGSSPDNKRPQMAGDAVLDVLAMALKACDRLPHFASNLEDWRSYTEYVMANSSSLRARALSHAEWWPEVTPYARSAQAVPSGADHADKIVTDAQIKAAKIIAAPDRMTGRKTPATVRKAAEAAARSSTAPERPER